MKKIFGFFLLFLISFHLSADGRNCFQGAQWIGATTDAYDSLADRSVVISRQVEVHGKVRKAVVKICGLGLYELYVGDKKVSNDIFSPACSDYSKTVFYNTYNVTAFFSQVLKKKDSKLTVNVLLGNGFYHERGLRYHKLKSNFGPLTLLFRLDIDYSDGCHQTVVSDCSWKWRKSAVTFNSIYGGEDYDARYTSPGHSFHWHPAVVQSPPAGRLRPQITYPVRIMERLGVARKLPRHVFDMGQNLAGFPEISLRGKSGQVVKILVGETLSEDGNVNQKQTGAPYYYQLILKDGLQVYHPFFSYYGFRYIQVEGAVSKGEPNPQNLPVIEGLQSCFIYNSAPKTGSFECSNDRLNATCRIIDRAIRSNWQGIWTDCPHREKLGWLEQDWLNGPGLVYNYDCKSMIEQTMQNIADAQHADGSMPEIAPEYIHFKGSWAPPFQESPEWGGALIALPFLYMDHYGDSSLVRKYYPQMRRYVDYLHSRDSCYILKMGLGDWYDYGKGRAGFSKNTPVPLVATAHYYLWAKRVGQAAMIFGHVEDAVRYAGLAEQIKSAFQKTFFSVQTSDYGTGSQASNAIPLGMGLVPEAEHDKVMEHLVADIYRHGCRLTTGDIGNRYLFEVLMKNGQGDLLYRMLDHDSLPGYGYQIKKGMTTLAEQWDPDKGASRNHFMLAHINNLLIPYIAGIQISGDKVVINPHPIGNLTWVRASAMSGKGRVSVEWHVKDSVFFLHIESPVKVKIENEEINCYCRLHHLQFQYDVCPE
jgi:hypothetical protein